MQSATLSLSLLSVIRPLDLDLGGFLTNALENSDHNRDPMNSLVNCGTTFAVTYLSYFLICALW
jgi:hypothetical protein